MPNVHHTQIEFDSATKKYRVRAFDENSKRLSSADYFTDTIWDAQRAARMMANENGILLSIVLFASSPRDTDYLASAIGERAHQTLANGYSIWQWRIHESASHVTQVALESLLREAKNDHLTLRAQVVRGPLS